MNTKIISAVCCLTLLAGCVNQKELDEKVKNEYRALSCEELNQRYDAYAKLKADKENMRDVVNGVSLVVGLVGILSGNGSIAMQGEDHEDWEYQRQLKLLGEVMKEKKCNDVAAFLDQRLDETDPMDELQDPMKKDGLPSETPKETVADHDKIMENPDDELGPNLDR